MIKDILHKLKYLKGKLKNKEIRQLSENFASLFTLQGLNYILPLITFPYLVRVLGPDKYGLIAFASAFIGYFGIIVDYGFKLSAPREVAINRNNKEKLSEIFSSIMVIKIVFMILSFIVLCVVVFSFEKFKHDWIVYIFTFIGILGNVLFPVWFFQGMERMKYITFLNIISKTIFTISIFVFIKNTSDYIYVPLINSLGYLVAGVLSLIFIFKEFNVVFKIPTKTEIIHQLKEGWHIFVSTVSINTYTKSNMVILGLFTNNTIVGYFAAGYRLIQAFLGMLNPISQTFYPYISRLTSESKEKAISVIKKLIKGVGVFTFILSLLIFIFADLIVKIVLGEQYYNSTIVIRILAFLPFIIGLSNIFGIQTMLTFGHKRAFTKIIIAGGITNIILAVILVPFWKHIGISISILITEIVITLSMYIYLKWKKII
ncbi:flippase [Methanothermococcus sp.]|uniref:flippase n=1 Tax=Methanothermococcus sp. TaxID=2614238 RepID=UPI0025EEA9CF|nr:flippase [Methanothermococcus sp.]